MTTGLVKKENTIWPPENPSNLPRDDPFVPHLDWLHPSLIDYDDLSYTHSVDIRTLITPRPDYFAFDPEYRTLRGGNVVETVSTTAGCTLLLTEGWLVGGYLYVTTVEYRSRR